MSSSPADPDAAMRIADANLDDHDENKSCLCLDCNLARAYKDVVRDALTRADLEAVAREAIALALSPVNLGEHSGGTVHECARCSEAANLIVTKYIAARAATTKEDE